jgi:hypothetical protein
MQFPTSDLVVSKRRRQRVGAQGVGVGEPVHVHPDAMESPMV